MSGRTELASLYLGQIAMEPSETFAKIAQINSRFTPAAPLRDRELFCGRVTQILDVISGVQEPGRHVILFGERGVGKTSLANILDQLLLGVSAEVGTNTIKISADTSDN